MDQLIQLIFHPRLMFHQKKNKIFKLLIPYVKILLYVHLHNYKLYLVYIFIITYSNYIRFKQIQAEYQIKIKKLNNIAFESYANVIFNNLLENGLGDLNQIKVDVKSNLIEKKINGNKNIFE